jgi:hypothetical protein
VRVVISPRRGAQLSPKPSVALKERNRNIRSIRRLGRREWHKWSGYSKRSMVENAVYRYKTIIGRGMRSRTACRVLNTMTRLGMPDSYRVGRFCLGERGSCAQFRAMQQSRSERED